MKRQRVVFSWDKDGNEPIDEIGFDDPIKIGESRDVEIWIQNLGKWTLTDLNFGVDSDEIEIVSAPKEIQPFSSEPLKLRITPREPEGEEDEKPIQGSLTLEYSYTIK